VFGALAVQAGLTVLEAQGFSFFIFAGSAQFIAVGMVQAAAPAVLIVATIFVVNLRHALYSASLAPYLAHLPRRWKIALSWLLTDEAFAMASLRYRKLDNRLAHWYTLGTGVTLWAAWQLSTLGGILLGTQIPASWGLDFALPLTFIALLVMSIDDRPGLVAALSAAVTAVFLFALPFRLGILAAAGVGILCGLAAQGLQGRRGRRGTA
jgi:4-azaleucine resistance transporter AzlC